MKDYQKRMIAEHSQLVTRIEKLHQWVYGTCAETDDKVEYANKCIQLSAMKKYEEALRARLSNSGIVFENGQYFESIGSVEHINKVANCDCDVDTKCCSNE